MNTSVASPAPLDIKVSASGDLREAVDYAKAKIGRSLRVADRPVRAARVRLTRHGDPAVQRPVLAQANVDVDGRWVRAHVEGATAVEAIDRLDDRLRRRLRRAAQHWEARRGGLPTGAPHEWRHQSEPEQRPAYFPRPAEDRRVVRRKAFSLGTLTLDEAAVEMDLLDYDFHLFTEKATGYAAVLSRDGQTGYRLTLVAPRDREDLAPFDLPVTISGLPAPCWTTEQATEHLELSGSPYLFFIEAAGGRACVLYHRYDGHYGLITPAG